MRMCLIFFLASVFLWSDTALASSENSLSVEAALKTHSFDELSPFRMSPDGHWLALTVRDNQRIQHSRPSSRQEMYVRTGVNVHDSAGDIWLCDIETGELTNISGGIGDNWGPSWSPDGRYLAFLSDRSPDLQAHVWVWDSLLKQLKMVSNLPIRAQYEVNPIEWLPDSRRVLITAVPVPLSIPEYIDRVFVPSRIEENNVVPSVPGLTVSLFESGSEARPNPGPAQTLNLDGCCLHDLVVIDVIEGTVKPVVQGARIEKYLVSPDGIHLAYAIPRRFEKIGSWRRVFDLMVADLHTGSAVKIADNVLLNDSFSWSPDGKQLAYAVFGNADTTYELFLANIERGAPRKLASLDQSAATNWLIPVWDANGEAFYFLLKGDLWVASLKTDEVKLLSHISGRKTTHILTQSDGELWTANGSTSATVLVHDDEQKQDGFYRVNLVTGHAQLLLERGECYTCKWVNAMDSLYLTAVSPDGKRVIYVAENSEKCPNLWVSDYQFRDQRQLTHWNPQFEQYRLGSARLVSWYSGDGQLLHGALLLPSRYNPGERCPLIVWVYPGSIQSDALNQFALGGFPGPFNFQLLATRGYAVLLPDSPEMIGDRAGSLAKSVLPGIDQVIAMGVADPDRVGVMGHSQGGYAVLALIAETKRFKVAVSADGWGDFTAYFGLMDKSGGSYQHGQAERQLGGTPWQYPMRYVQNSPVYYLDRVETPLLLVHGSNDDSHPSFLADEVFVGLRRLGKPVEYARYEGETHAPQNWNYANQVDLANRILSWTDKQLNHAASAKQR